jgi:hypothetical protein
MNRSDLPTEFYVDNTRKNYNILVDLGFKLQGDFYEDLGYNKFLVNKTKCLWGRLNFVTQKFCYICLMKTIQLHIEQLLPQERLSLGRFSMCDFDGI